MAGDIHFAQVVSLLHFDSDLTDVAGKTWTGTAAPSAAQTKFGPQSLRTTSAQYINSSASSDWAFGTGDFTVESWIRQDVLQDNYASPFGNLTATAGCCFWVRPVSSNPGALTWRARDGSSIGITSANNVIAAETWHHIAYARQSGTGRLFVDGVLVASGTDGSTYTTTNTPGIGRNGLSADYFTGYIDDLRVTKGVARYTANFTPPAAPHPDRLPILQGTVRDAAGNLAARTVRAYRRDTGALTGAAVSDDITGAFSVDTAHDGEHTVIALDDEAGDVHNAQIFDRVIPV